MRLVKLEMSKLQVLLFDGAPTITAVEFDLDQMRLLFENHAFHHFRVLTSNTAITHRRAQAIVITVFVAIFIIAGGGLFL
jgi:hypothetical protein